MQAWMMDCGSEHSRGLRLSPPALLRHGARSPGGFPVRRAALQFVISWSVLWQPSAHCSNKIKCIFWKPLVETLAKKCP